MFKKILFLMLFVSGFTITQAQQRFPLDACGCPGSSSTWTSSDGMYKITYKGCPDGTVEMVSFEWTGTGMPFGWITAMEGFNAFFDVNSGIAGLKMPANCLKWKQTGKKIAPDSPNGFTPIYGLFLCDELNGPNVDCCELTQEQARGAVEFMFHSPDNQCEDANQRCFKLCGYVD